MRIIMVIGMAGCLFLSGCGFWGTLPLPVTPGETASAHGYVPLDALPVETLICGSSEPNATILHSLPDLSIRFAVAAFDADGSLSFGPSRTTVKDKTYRAVLDYVNADVVPVDFYVRRRLQLRADSTTNDGQYAPLGQPLQPGDKVAGYDVRISPAFMAQRQEDAERANPAETRQESTMRGRWATARKEAEIEIQSLENAFYKPLTIPLYIGVGLRLSADIRARENNLELSGLGAIGAQAEQKKLSGTLTVQTLGVNGGSIALALPLPNKLDQTTIETALLAMGSTRALLYSTNQDRNVIATPRVVGLYSPIGADPALINAMYSEISRLRPRWAPPCPA